MNIRTKNQAVKKSKIFDSPKLKNKKLFAKWILIEDKLTCIWWNDN